MFLWCGALFWHDMHNGALVGLSLVAEEKVVVRSDSSTS